MLVATKSIENFAGEVRGSKRANLLDEEGVVHVEEEIGRKDKHLHAVLSVDPDKTILQEYLVIKPFTCQSEQPMRILYHSKC